MKWISTKKDLPKSSGEYFVACTMKGERKPYYYAYVNYSAKHKQFNNRDEFEYDEDNDWSDVSHWMAIEAPEFNE